MRRAPCWRFSASPCSLPRGQRHACAQLMALLGEPEQAKAGSARARRQSPTVADQIGGAVARGRGIDVPAGGLRASPRSSGRRGRGLVARADRFGVRRDAAMLRVRLLMKRDRFAAAEELLPVALRAWASTPSKRARRCFLFNLEGRFTEVRSLVQEGWDSYPDRFGLLRQLAILDSINPLPMRRSGPLCRGGRELAG